MKTKSLFRETIETVFTVILLVLVIRAVIGEPRWIPSASMRATLMEQDRVFIEKISLRYNLRDVKRGDILVFYPPFDDLKSGVWAKFTRIVGVFDKNEAFIKRVIALEGETYEITRDPKTGGSAVYIDGKRLNEPYLYENDTIDCTDTMYCGPAVVPKGHYLMLGDNRANSSDGRSWGYLPKDRIIGKAAFRFWPLNRLTIFIAPKY